MTRFTRTFVLPLLFASFGVSAVVAFGEPVTPVTCGGAESTDIAFADSPAVVASEAVEVVEVEEAAKVRSVDAARMRWSITLPSPRRSSCCRL
jgi:hypothetical protein